ncbi:MULTISPECIES: flagellar export chaperone FliS [Gammaproteobacteria]|uniref:flagellar export chaperone FliS n=1 Tax=Gammaproteobacteria TaxID=1236 RepID=UPI001ADA527A|nr:MULTISPECIES: flagellar export chaperone FliS [Gammaproteobacteria]MBO9480852.1 flagellar export chaperone FliS [Salinisphaera sp. G21_0]MBO9495222.1 flagellar export chaperone FliS [Thalassotalea sp. G20_0]
MKRAGISAYQQQQRASVEVAKPEQLVATLFNKLMETLAKARHYMEEKDLSKKVDRINLSMDILLVLEQSLDHEKGGELADNLQGLYQYCIKRLTEANASNDVTMIDEVSGLMGEIREGWQSVVNGTVEDSVVASAG